MDPITQSVLDKQIDALSEAVDMLIKHRESITDNTDEFGSTDMKELTEPTDTQIFSCIEGIINITNQIPKTGVGGTLDG